MAGELDDDLEIAPGDAGAAFRAEMAATNVLLGYWKHMVAVLIVGLLAVLFYGQYQNWALRDTRATASEISDVIADLPAPLEAMNLLGDDGGDPEALKKASAELVVIGDGATGMAAAEAYVRAAELAHLAKDPVAERAALEKVVETGVQHLAGTAKLGIAILDQADGKTAEAVTALTALKDAPEGGFIAQQAALELGTLHESLDQKAEAKAVYDGFLAKWPDSPSAEEVRTRIAGLGE